MMKMSLMLTLALGVLACGLARAETGSSGGNAGVRDFRCETAREKAERLQWWTDARFGLFIHYGLYALPARVSEWIRTRERMTPERYDVYRRHFNPDRFDAREWARIARRAGVWAARMRPIRNTTS